jgi:ZIP family zinc transporter
MIIVAILLAIATFISTLLGGLFAIRHKTRLHHIMAFAAGVLLGVVAFDIFPEIIRETQVNNFNPAWVMVSLVVGFLVFHVLEKSILIQHCHDEECFTHHKHPDIGIASAMALAGHSFVDGVGIGLGFQVSTTVGLLVAIAVISHDFTDGMNAVSLMLNHRNSDKKSVLFLLLVAVAPVLGVISTTLFTVPASFLVMYLGFLAGFLLYIGASDILPEAHSKQSSYGLMSLTIFGALLIFIITRFI